MVSAPKNYSENSPLALHSGDRMMRNEFHRIYENMPDDFKAELIGGIVYVASPLGLPHATSHAHLVSVFTIYKGSSPGVQTGDNATVMLTEEDEVQPDLFMRVLSAWGGQSHDTGDKYIQGAPELVAEIAHSSRAIDLHFKRERYKKAGVLEYLVLCLDPHKVYWFDLRNEQTLSPDDQSVFRSAVFPGLWIHSDALLQENVGQLLDTLNQGLSSPEHGTFVGRLAAKNAEFLEP